MVRITLPGESSFLSPGRFIATIVCLAAAWPPTHSMPIDAQQVVNGNRLFVVQAQIAAVGNQESLDSIDRQAQLFQSFGIEPNESSIKKYLLGLIPSDDIEASLEPIVELLSHDSFDVREKATRDLKKFPGLSQEALRRLSLTVSNPETLMRLGEVIKWLDQPDTTRLQFAIFQKIENEPLEHLAEVIVSTAPYIAGKAYIQRAAGRALTMSSTASDIPLLENVAADHSVGEWLRIGALQALARLDPSATPARLSELAVTGSGNSGLEIARQLASNRDNQCFELLIRLTGDENLSVATQAWTALRGMTANSVSLNELLDPVTRDDSIKKLRDHISNSSNKISFDWNSGRTKLGRTLIADYQSGIVREFDAAGQQTWSHQGNSTFACQGLPNGHRLVSSYSDDQLLEFDESGTLLKSIKLLHGSPSSVMRLDNGNTLVTAAGANIPVVEYSPDGISVREFKTGESTTTAELLENGNLLVARFDKNQIAEIDALGNTIWKMDVQDQPYHASRLDNGNFLVAFCNAREIREYNRDGKIVWSHKTAAKPFRAQRLMDGTTVIAGPKGVLFVAPDGSETPITDGIEFGDTLYVNYF